MISHNYLDRMFKQLCQTIVKNGKTTVSFTEAEIAEREAKETIHDEWHRTPELKRKITAIMRHVFDPAGNKDLQVLVAHHLCYKYGDDGEEKEIASVETLIFDQEVLRKIYRDAWRHNAQQLSTMSPVERVDYLYASVLARK